MAGSGGGPQRPAQRVMLCAPPPAASPSRCHPKWQNGRLPSLCAFPGRNPVPCGSLPCLLLRRGGRRRGWSRRRQGDRRGNERAARPSEVTGPPLWRGESGCSAICRGELAPPPSVFVTLSGFFFFFMLV